jgi:hypothetical protein
VGVTSAGPKKKKREKRLSVAAFLIDEEAASGIDII